MKQHFLFKHYATRLLLVSFFALSAAVQVHAQAFDGDSDRKFFLGYTNVGGKNGVELGYENGINDYLSYGAKYAFIVDKSVDSNDDGPTFYDNSDLGFYLNFHLMEPLKLPDNCDIYMGPVISLKTMSFQTGARYNFGELFGVYASAQYNFFPTLARSEISGLYPYKFVFSAGITLSF